jgi:hypothetical protein
MDGQRRHPKQRQAHLPLRRCQRKVRNIVSQKHHEKVRARRRDQEPIGGRALLSRD